MRIWIAALTAMILQASVASADTLDDAKAKGWLGEKINGYLGLVDTGAPPDIAVLMNEINAKREAKYAEIAKSRGVSIDAVGAIAAKKVFEQAASGTYFMDGSGEWKRK